VPCVDGGIDAGMLEQVCVHRFIVYVCVCVCVCMYIHTYQGCPVLMAGLMQEWWSRYSLVCAYIYPHIYIPTYTHSDASCRPCLRKMTQEYAHWMHIHEQAMNIHTYMHACTVTPRAVSLLRKLTVESAHWMYIHAHIMQIHTYMHTEIHTQ
jgi:hypothetical protein